MREKLGHLFRDERGNIALFVLGMLGIMMVLFILVMNLGSVLATKERSGTTTSQASLAATSTLYEEVRTIITNYSYPEPTPPTPPDSEADESAWDAYEEAKEEYEKKLEVYEFFFYFDDSLESKKSGMTGIWYNNWSDNELELEALDKVIHEALDSGGELLQEKLEELLYGNGAIQNAAIEMAIDTIYQNGGVIEGAELDIEDNRIVIKAANEVTSTSYDEIMVDITENVYQESAGPVVDFLNLIWTKPTPVNLEYE
ncbi:Tad domain-containing protein [Ornithinibacillus xuwenensis]|uniref:Tad domain-containing protein n=1 Tax=Ornithinibacillus xuwenensis TaxID=3144668 RepID=A0ABU9XJ62_9BACI